jgi:RND family efflux transporter MFP subunit
MSASACSSASAPEPAAPALPVAVMVAQADGPVGVERAYRGVVRAARSTALGFEREGRIRSISADDGDAVNQGQVLARLDTERLSAERTQLQAGLRQVEAQEELSSLTARRVGRLAAQEYASRQAEDESKLRLQATAARRQEVEASLARIRVELDKSVLRAPFDGVVVRRHADEGAVIGPGRPVLELQERHAAEAEVGVPRAQRSLLVVGQTYSLWRDGRVLSATLSGLVERVERRTRTVAAIFQLPSGQDWVPDEVVELRLSQALESEGLWIPLTSLVQGPRGSWAVYVVPGSAATAEVELAAVEVLHTEGDRVHVAGTLEPGDRVVADGVHRVVPGQRVRVQALPDARQVVKGDR